MSINVTTRRIKVENVIGEAVKQANIIRDITLPVPAKKIESIDTQIRDVKSKVIENKVIVEAILHKQIYYVECVTGDVQEYTVPDEKITEFVHLDGVEPGMDVRTVVDIEYCDVEAIDMVGDNNCHTRFQQTCIVRIKVKVIEMLEFEVVTDVSGVGIIPTYQTVVIDNVIGAACEQYNLSDSFIELPDAAVKIKSVDAEIQETEETILPDKVIIKGKLHKQIYYVVEPGREVRETHADVPFSVFVHIPGAKKGAMVTTDVRIEYIDNELVVRNGRKYVKETVVLQICAKVTEPITICIVTAVAGAEYETRTLSIENAVGEGRRQVNILANFVTPTEARKVAKVDAEVRDLEGKAIPNKVIIKGVLHKQIYYVSAVDDQLREISLNEPFTEFIHIDGVRENDMVDVTARIEYVNVEAAAPTPTTNWRQTAVLEIIANVTQTEELTVVVAVKEADFCEPGESFDYVIQKGDTLMAIAIRFNKPLKAILEANPQIKDPNIIFVGMTIKIPCTIKGMG